MIDVVFVLLTYFMLASSFEAPETEMAFRLPGLAEPGAVVDLPDEQIIEVRADGQAVLNEQAFDVPGRGAYRELEGVLTRFRMTCEAAGIGAAITIAAEDEAAQQAVIRVLDAARRAGISDVRFALGSPG
jgi:biopolymer transport protein ExbD